MRARPRVFARWPAVVLGLTARLGEYCARGWAVHHELWTAEEDDFLRLNYHSMSLEEIVRNLERTKETVRTRAFLIGLKGRGGMVQMKRDNEYMQRVMRELR